MAETPGPLFLLVQTWWAKPNGLAADCESAISRFNSGRSPQFRLRSWRDRQVQRAVDAVASSVSSTRSLRTEYVMSFRHGLDAIFLILRLR